MANKKFWIDTLVANELGERLIPLLKDLFKQGYTAVIAETIVDIRGFHGHQHRNWIVERILAHDLIIEAFYSDINDLTNKQFTWSFCSITTEASPYFIVAVMNLPNHEEILELSDIVSYYKISKEQWLSGRPAYKATDKLSPEVYKTFGLSESATRTDVLSVAKATDRMDLFEEFNAIYVEGLARQHDCCYVLSMNGVTKLPPQN